MSLLVAETLSPKFAKTLLLLQSTPGSPSKPELEWFSSSKIQPKNAKKKRRRKVNNRTRKENFYNFYDIEDDNLETNEIVSGNSKTKIRTEVFLASLDQRSIWVNGRSACSVLSLFIAHWLHINQDLPTRPQFNRLVIEGSNEWNSLCKNELNLVSFPDGHFDLKTLEESFVGFFFPEKFEMLKEVMSFDDTWDNIISDEILTNKPKIYIVSWNDHFFVLKVEEDACYVINSLGRRLHNYCNSAYILKFNESSVIYDLINKEEEDEGENQSEKNKEKTNDQIVICTGKECCREFIKRFWATITLRDFEEEKKKGKLSNTTLFQKLQIEFHCTYLNPPSPSSSSPSSSNQSADSYSSTQFAFSSED
ncbi:hypothetical protein UlMin_036002 [Ulmus minor]